MTRVVERFLEEITQLAKDGYGIVDSNLARIINVTNPSSAQDALTLNYLTSYVLSGDASGTLSNISVTSGNFGGDNLDFNSIEDGYLLIRNGLAIESEDSQNLEINTLSIEAFKNSGGIIPAGKCVTIFDYADGYFFVETADNSNNSLMPSVGIAVDDITDGTSGKIVIAGIASGIDTSAFSINDSVYTGTNGDLVNERPIDSVTTAVQYLGVVARVDSINGIIIVRAGKIEDIPNSLDLTTKEIVEQETSIEDKTWTITTQDSFTNTTGSGSGAEIEITEGIDVKITFEAYALSVSSGQVVYYRNVKVQGFHEIDGYFALYSPEPEDYEGVNTDLSIPVGISTSVVISNGTPITGAYLTYTGNGSNSLSWILYATAQYNRIDTP